MPQQINKSTIKLLSCPSILSYAAVAGQKEGEGPLGRHFDILYDDATIGEKSFEKAESLMQKEAASTALSKAGFSPENVDIVFAGDLLNQCIGSSYGLRDLNIPFLGLFGACSTMAESLLLSSLFVESLIVKTALAVTSSHFCTAERQFRFPLEYGGQRTPASQWTATAAGACFVGASDKAPYIKSVTIGKIVDLGIKDMNNMGSAMAPAAADTIQTFLNDTGTTPDDYDMILTGDLGQVGSSLLIDLLKRDSIDISGKHNDCGLMIYDMETQDVNAGGSGCGCSAGVLCSYILKRIEDKTLSNVLFVATGALMSPVASQQGETIPGIAHLVHLSSQKWGES